MKAQQIVLVIDQDPMMRETLKDVFAERPDYHLLTFQEANGFSSAEELINSADLDVLVADVLTRGANIGRGLIERAVTRHPKLAVVLVSADPAHYAENYPSRAVCLQKPFSADQLLAAIDDAKSIADTYS
jgi:Response regulator containing CheY-like receiver, AAA-type ATPase, and DNA-binding domains